MANQPSYKGLPRTLYHGHEKVGELVRFSYWRQAQPSHQIISSNQAISGYFLLLKDRESVPSKKTIAVAALCSQDIMLLARIIEKHGDSWTGLKIKEKNFESEIEAYIKEHLEA